MNIKTEPIASDVKRASRVVYGSLVRLEKKYYMLLDTYPEVTLAEIETGKTKEISEDTKLEIIDHQINLK